MNTLPERADADRIHAGSGASTPFIHAQRFADGWNACLNLIELSHMPAINELIAAARDAAAILQSKSGSLEQETPRRLYDAIARLGGAQ